MKIDIETGELTITLKLSGKEKVALGKEISQFNDRYEDEGDLWNRSYPLLDQLWNSL